jgi:hypothetical protein
MGPNSTTTSAPSNRPNVQRLDILGFREVSLISMISFTGKVPTHNQAVSTVPLEDIRRSSSRPVVVFPECTTSNGRGLLRFAELFKGRAVPVKDYKVYVVCFRFDL